MKKSKDLTNANANRRRFLAAMGAGAGLWALPHRLHATDAIGSITELTGRATADRGGSEITLEVGTGIAVRDLIRTGTRSFLTMRFGDQTSMRLGEETELLIDRYLLEVQGSFDLANGALVFDRPEEAVKTPTTVRTVFGQLGVRGTRFFAGPSQDVFGVFVDRGQLDVTAAGITQSLGPGDGVDIDAPGDPASEVAQWGQGRIDAAFASVMPG
ncbi:MAG: FecR family protein [Pseudomonadota bacterium]